MAVARSLPDGPGGVTLVGPSNVDGLAAGLTASLGLSWCMTPASTETEKSLAFGRDRRLPVTSRWREPVEQP